MTGLNDGPNFPQAPCEKDNESEKKKLLSNYLVTEVLTKEGTS